MTIQPRKKRKISRNFINIHLYTSHRQSTSHMYIMFYYTPQFLSVVPDVEGYIDDMLATANAGFANSQVDLMVHKFCLAEASIDEILDTSEMLVQFRNTFGCKHSLFRDFIFL